MSSVLISWGFIIILQMDTTLLTSIPTNLKRITPCSIQINLSNFAHMKQCAHKTNTQMILHAKSSHWWAHWKMLLWDKLTRFLRPTFSNFAYSGFPSFTSLDDTLRCTNSKCSSQLSFIQCPTMSKKVCNPSSLYFLQDTTDMHNWRIMILPKSNLDFCLFVRDMKIAKFPWKPFGSVGESKSPPFSIQHTPTQQCSSTNQQMITNNLKSMSFPQKWGANGSALY